MNEHTIINPISHKRFKFSSLYVLQSFLILLNNLLLIQDCERERERQREREKVAVYNDRLSFLILARDDSFRLSGVLIVISAMN